MVYGHKIILPFLEIVIVAIWFWLFISITRAYDTINKINIGRNVALCEISYKTSKI
jgi:hypothetical protein